MKKKYAFISVAKRELSRILHKRSLYILLIIAPPVIFLLFALIFRSSLLRNIPVAVYDEDKSSLSLLITRYVEATPSMEVVKYVNSLEELKQEFLKGNVKGAFYLPKNMERDVKKGKQANPVIFINSMNLIISNNILNDGVKIIKTVSGGALLKKFRSSGAMENQAMDIVNPVKIDTQIMYNPNYSYEQYLFPGLAVFTLMMIIMLTSVLLISSEFVHNTFPDLLNAAQNKISAIIIGKSIPHIIIHSINIIILIGVIFPLFGISINGHVIITLLFLIFFVVVSFFFGIAISSLFHDQMFATEIVLFYNIPAFIFSGLTFPLWAMPKAIAFYAQFILFTPFLSGFLKIYQVGTPLSYIFSDLIKLSIFLSVSLIVLSFSLRHHIKLFKQRSA
jgi:ABC-2 type transport system permease protein